MKKAIVISALTVLASASVFAQGLGTINFANAAVNRVSLAGGAAGVPTAASGGTYLAELLSAIEGTDFSTASRQGLTTTFNTPSAGVFNASTRTVPTAQNGGNGQFMVRVWDTRAGSTYELAWASQDSRYQAGNSGVFIRDTADPTPPAGTPTALNMPAFSLTVIPEPSVIGLGLLGASALLLLRRRK